MAEALTGLNQFGAKRGKLNSVDWAKIGKSFLLCIVAGVAGAVITFLDGLRDDPIIKTLDPNTALLIGTALTFVVNTIRKVCENNGVLLGALLCCFLIVGGCANTEQQQKVSLGEIGGNLYIDNREVMSGTQLPAPETVVDVTAKVPLKELLSDLEAAGLIKNNAMGLGMSLEVDRVVGDVEIFTESIGSRRQNDSMPLEVHTRSESILLGNKGAAFNSDVLDKLDRSNTEIHNSTKTEEDSE